jgi:hypothetical protein
MAMKKDHLFKCKNVKIAVIVANAANVEHKER